MKKNINKIIVSLCLLLMGIPFTSCDDFLDINDNPNDPATVQLSQILPSVQVDMVGALGMSSGGLSQITSSYMHQIVQRGTNINDYGIQGGDFGVITPWNLLYARALMDIEVIISQGGEEGATHYVAVAQILKAYAFSILVDVYGDAPYFEAFLGADNLQPTYDKGNLVYDEVFKLLDDAMINIESESTIAPGSEDLIFGGKMSKWKKLAKSIKLKLYNQIRLVQDVKADVDALILDDDLISISDDDFELYHGIKLSPDDRNPAWSQEYGDGNPGYYVSPFFFETMANINTFDHRNYGADLGGTVTDPRLPYYFFDQLPIGSGNGDAENPCSYCPSRSGTPFVSIWQFSYNIDPNEGFDQATSQTALGLYPIGGAFNDGEGSDGGLGPTLGNPGAPQRLLTAFAIKYIQAELFLSGAGTGDARVALEEALILSFEKVNEMAVLGKAPEIDQTDIDTYVAAVLTAYDAADNVGKMEHIMTQKWIASYGFAIDAYTDYRRTGFPILHDGNTDNLKFTVRTRDYPNSFPWVTQNLALNSKAPSQKIVTSDAAKPFWMK